MKLPPAPAKSLPTLHTPVWVQHLKPWVSFPESVSELHSICLHRQAFPCLEVSTLRLFFLMSFCFLALVIFVLFFEIIFQKERKKVKKNHMATEWVLWEVR